MAKKLRPSKRSSAGTKGSGTVKGGTITSGEGLESDQPALPSPPSDSFAGYSIPMAISIFPQAFAEVFGVPANVLGTQFKEACYHVIKSGERVSSPAREMFSGLLEGGFPSAGGNIPNTLEFRLRRALLVTDVIEGLKRGIS